MPSPSPPPIQRPAIGPSLRWLLAVVFGLIVALGVNSAWLASVTIAEWWTGRVLEDRFYLLMFLAHLALGLAIIVPVVWFGLAHMRNTWRRPNRRAVRAGVLLFAMALAVLVTGLALARFDLWAIRDPVVRRVVYWAHVVTPFVAAGLYVRHRRAGRRLQWAIGIRWAAVAVLLALGGLAWKIAETPPTAPLSEARPFQPALARVSTGESIPPRALMRDAECAECHADVHAGWSASAHRFSSFNNPAYRFAVRETKAAVLARDGHTDAARFCAGCHDLVPLFSGRFDRPDFDDEGDPTASAGITCTGCHAITALGSVRGNADYVIGEPVTYPFAFSEQPALRWMHRQLVKAKPALHQTTFLKPLHRTAEFCSACHKVNLPAEVNGYKWLRGQNHYDAWRQSGVSGHGVSSFYYPPKAVTKCAECHMPFIASEDFGAQDFADTGELSVHDHLFRGANTALAHFFDLPESVNVAHRAFLGRALRVDLFGLREGGAIDGALTAPLRPQVPALIPGRRYLLDVVVRTVGVGHTFTQGTADSNEIWVDITATVDGSVVGRSGGRRSDGAVDPWSHFLNAYLLDRDGGRIDRRNAQDIFVPLYNHQLPPGAADVIHYQLDVPADARGTLVVDVAVQYRKFDTTYMRYFQGDAFEGNDLPITTLAHDRVEFSIDGSATTGDVPAIPEWQRWNDYGIGLLRAGAGGAARGELRQAEAAFARVEALGRPDGPLNQARLYLIEGRLDEAVAALDRAVKHDPPPPSWSVNWFTGQVDLQNGFLDEALARFEALLAPSDEKRRRGFDFSKDTRLLNRLGTVRFEQAKAARGEARAAERRERLTQAVEWFRRTLEIDPEHAIAHHNLSLIYRQLGRDDEATHHRELHARYKPDDNARDHAISRHRRDNPAADHAAESIVIYDLHRLDAYDRNR